MASNKERQETNQTCSSIIHEFCLNTTAHGLPSVARSQSIHNRLFWSISFIGFLAATTYFIVKAIQAYLDYETKMDINYDKQWPQNFPAVSICPLSLFRLDQFAGPFLNFISRYHSANDDNQTDQQTTFDLSLLQEFVIDTLNRNESLKPYAFSLESILQSCFFNGIPCSAANFTAFFSSYYGLCFTFNAKLKDAPDGGIRLDNIGAGIGVLSLNFFVHAHQYLPYISPGAGMLLLVHDNVQVPLIDAVGLELSTGRRHKLSYTKRETTLVSSPIKQCTEIASEATAAVMATYEGADYTYSDIPCYQGCEQSFTYDICGCVNPNVWNVRTVLLSKTQQVITVSLCNSTNPCPNLAKNALYSSSKLLGEYCNCIKPCSMVDFLIRQSSSRAPLDSNIDSIKSFVENSGVPQPDDWSTEYRRYIENNYVAVAVLRETTTVEYYTQSFSLSAVDVLSNVGGQTGLWIGISFFSIMELVEMIYRLIRHQCCLLRALI